MIFNYFEDEKKLLYFEHGVDEIPEEIIAEFSVKDVTHVDFSSNSLVSLDCISHFSNLKEVIFDNNFLSDATLFPKTKFPNIVVLSLNNNKLENLNQLLQNLVQCFPNIRYLSLLGNSLCPALLQDFNEETYRAYRLSIINRMLKLKFLDAKRVDKSELLSSLQLEATNSRRDPLQNSSEHREERMETFEKIKRFFGITPRDSVRSPIASVSQQDAYNPLPVEDLIASPSSQNTIYGRVKTIYEGSQSQGNRFILNQDL